jgi:hypothetical protein
MCHFWKLISNPEENKSVAFPVSEKLQKMAYRYAFYVG